MVTTTTVEEGETPMIEEMITTGADTTTEMTGKSICTLVPTLPVVYTRTSPAKSLNSVCNCCCRSVIMHNVVCNLRAGD